MFMLNERSAVDGLALQGKRLNIHAKVHLWVDLLFKFQLLFRQLSIIADLPLDFLYLHELQLLGDIAAEALIHACLGPLPGEASAGGRARLVEGQWRLEGPRRCLLWRNESQLRALVREAIADTDDWDEGLRRDLAFVSLLVILDHHIFARTWHGRELLVEKHDCWWD